MAALGLASSRPVGLPALSRTISPPGAPGVSGVAHGAQRGVEQGAVVQVQDEDRRVGRDGVDLLQRGQALLGELVLGEAAHHAHPLRGRGDGDLGLEHGHRIGQAARRPSAAPC
jgi:hypothetical protein